MRRSAAIFGVFLLAAATGCRRSPPDGAVHEHVALQATLGADGVSLRVPAGPIGAGCTGSTGVTVGRGDGAPFDAAKVTTCARHVRTTVESLRHVNEVDVNASSETRYGDVIALLDALRNDDAGDLFSDVKFEMPTTPPQRTMRPIALDAGTSGFFVVGAATDEGTPVIVSKTQILVRDELVLKYDGPASAAAHGLPAALKPEGEAGYYIAPLGERLQKDHDLEAQARAAQKQGGAFSVTLIMDADVPYRLFAEVLHTATEAGFETFHLMVIQGAKKEPDRR